MDKLDRILGSFLGLICGDALGGPVEFMSANDIKRCYGVLKDMVGGGCHFLEPGEYTDDSAMAIATAESLAEVGDWSPEDVAKRFIQWMDSMPKDMGGTTTRALMMIKYGASWQEAGESVNRAAKGYAAGNGSIMRCAPVAYFSHSLGFEDLVRMSQECSTITHADERCQWGCVAVNSSIATMLEGESDIQRVISITLDSVDNRDVIMAIETGINPNRSPGVSGYVLDTLQVAYRALSHTSSFEDAVVYAVNVGGDTDTHAAVAGALAGAYYGFKAIPERWLEVIQNRDELIELGERIGRLSCASSQ